MGLDITFGVLLRLGILQRPGSAAVRGWCVIKMDKARDAGIPISQHMEVLRETACARQFCKHSFIKQMFIEHLLHVKHGSRCWGTIANKRDKNFCPMELTCSGSGDRTQGWGQPGDQGGRRGAQFV